MPVRRVKTVLNDERGQGQALTLIFAVFFLALLLGLGVFVAHVQPVKVAVQAAARNCARMAVETLSQQRGPEQALTAAYETLARQNFDPAYAVVTFEQGGEWDRGQVIGCRVQYAVDVGWMPFVGLFYGGDSVPMEAVAMSRVEPYKSRWED